MAPDREEKGPYEERRREKYAKQQTFAYFVRMKSELMGIPKPLSIAPSAE
jgi:hypothetical protein